ncbi:MULTISPECIES: SDR family NAD(P)-dependent oxidoreductase [unclassified Streptomyces]|uniref:SDR family NAD(P)-dependent oxidoreductase n=1 Tax=unclassified Streptomyces TaxID=2593676 RepID=UPI0038695B3F
MREPRPPGPKRRHSCCARVPAVRKSVIVDADSGQLGDFLAPETGHPAVCPGLVETPMLASLDPNEDPLKSLIAAHPLGRIADAGEIADAVVWLCSDKASFVTGIALPVDGGYTVP